MKINDNIKFLIHGKSSETGELLMIPVYNPEVGEYLVNKLILDNKWDRLIVETPTNNIIFKR